MREVEKPWKEKSRDAAGYLELCLGHITLETFIRHPSGDVESRERLGLQTEIWELPARRDSKPQTAKLT